MESSETVIEVPMNKYNSKKRFAILVYPEVQQGMLKLAKQYKVSQSIIAETLYNMADLEKLGELLSLKFAEKIEAKNSMKEIIKRLSGMSNEQLAGILAQADQKLLTNTTLKNRNFYA